MSRFAIGLALIPTVPALYLRLTGIHTTPGAEALLFGIAILGAAFLLTWAAEVAEMDISQGLALAFLALIAVLPEYAVDLYFAWQAPHQPEYTSYATANMTGSNRLLIGIAWPLIVFLHWRKTRRTELVLPNSRSIELAFLTLATVYSFVIPFKHTISLWDSLVLVGLFVAYMWRIAHAETGEPELVGPSALIATLRPWLRRTVVVSLFVFGAACIFASAEPFAEALIHGGKNLGIDEFLLVQWLAPFASEAPEVVIACILTLKGDAQAGMGAIVSSKVTQWTLLVGTMALVYSISAGGPGVIDLDARQQVEILLTAAQSAFAVAILADLRLSLLEAGGLFFLFIGQFFAPAVVQALTPLIGEAVAEQLHIRYIFAVAYLALAAVMIFRQRHVLPRMLRMGLWDPVRSLGEAHAPASDCDG